MAFKLLPNKVYKTDPSTIGVVVFQPVGGDIQLKGTNVVKYKETNNSKKIIVPSLDDLITITDDMMAADTVNPMTCLTTWIAFEGDDAVVWVNGGIDITVTPADSGEIVQ
jgi:hypothetical protein